MPKFMFIYLDPAEMASAKPSPDEMQRSFQEWMSWLGKGKEEGWVVEMGEALAPEGKIVGANQEIMDGPLIEAKELVGGFSVIQAANYEEACQYASGCPIFAMGGRVSVRQVMDLPNPV